MSNNLSIAENVNLCICMSISVGQCACGSETNMNLSSDRWNAYIYFIHAPSRIFLQLCYYIYIHINIPNGRYQWFSDSIGVFCINELQSHMHIDTVYKIVNN